MSSSLPSKAALRTELRARRHVFVSAARADGRIDALNAAIARRVIAQMAGARAVSAYISDGDEVDPLPILAAAALGMKTALPFVTSRNAPMRFLRWAPGDPLEAGPFGLRQPRAAAEEIIPDLILTPLLGFDARLARIGQGAGYYDRAFAANPAARRIGLAWSVQACAILPLDPWDKPLHAIATERDWIETA